jgi:type I restriction enzyme, S subunit
MKLPRGWRRERLDVLARAVSGGTPSKQREDYWGGEIPWVTAKDLKSFFITTTGLHVTGKGAAEGSKIVPPGTVLVLVRGMALLKDVPIAVASLPVAFNQDVKAFLPAGIITGEFLAAALSHRKRELRSYVDLAGHGTGRLPSELLSAVQVAFPPLPEQRRIAAILRTADRQTELLRNLIRTKYVFFAAAREKLLAVKTGQTHGRKLPIVRLQDITTECTDRNSDGRLGTADVMGVHKNEGIVPMRGRTIGANIDRYKVLRPSAFAYNPMRLNIGSIARWTGESDVLVSPDYVVFDVIHEKVDVRFLEHFCRSNAWKRHVEAAGNGSVRVRIYYDDLAVISVPLPSLSHQRKTVEILEVIKREISTLERVLDLHEQHKRALMHKLLTGAIRAEHGATSGVLK